MPVGPTPNQRRSQRIVISAAVRVSGKDQLGKAFDENTSTIIVNSHGALISLIQKVAVGQTITLQLLSCTDEISCVVKSGDPGSEGIPEVAIEFEKANAKFWHISFPPAGWNSDNPEAKGFVPHPMALMPAHQSRKNK